MKPSRVGLKFQGENTKNVVFGEEEEEWLERFQEGKKIWREITQGENLGFLSFLSMRLAYMTFF